MLYLWLIGLLLVHSWKWTTGIFKHSTCTKHTWTSIKLQVREPVQKSHWILKANRYILTEICTGVLRLSEQFVNALEVVIVMSNKSDKTHTWTLKTVELIIFASLSLKRKPWALDNQAAWCNSGIVQCLRINEVNETTRTGELTGNQTVLKGHLVHFKSTEII